MIRIARTKYGFLAILCLLLVSSCRLKKAVPEGSYLLKKNKIKGTEHFSNTELEDQLYLQPNRKVAGIFRARMWMYNWGFEKKGEKPVLIDSAAAQASADNLSRYLFNKGYFNNSVSYKITKKRKRKAQVWYYVEENRPYTYKFIGYEFADPVVDSILRSEQGSLFNNGDVVDFDVIGKERARMTNMLRDRGFYYFNRAFIDFQLDTSAGNHQVETKVFVKNPEGENGHVRSTIDEVVIDVRSPDHRKKNWVTDTFEQNNMRLIYYDNYIKPKVLTRNVLLKKGEYFSQTNLENTYSRMYSLGLFRTINIKFEELDSLGEKLRCVLELSPSAKHDFTWEPQVLTSEQSLGIQEDRTRNYGIANLMSLNNKNLLHNGERLSLSSKTSVETQLGQGRLTRPNFMQNFTLSLVYPRLLIFKNLDETLKNKYNQTSLNLSYIYERNIQYERTLFPITYTYQFRLKEATFNFSPASITFNRAQVSSDFTDQLSAQDSIFVERLFTNNLITGGKLSFVYSKKIKDDDNLVLRGDILELSGNIINGIYDLATDVPLGKRTFLGVPYSQFFRTSLEVVYTFVWDKRNVFVFRVNSGIGLPYGNSTLLPFDRRFFVGGSNSLRGWRPRTVGPGSFSDQSTLRIDKSGEFMLVGNVEYRFDIFEDFVEGALFFDAGNIWNIKEEQTFSEGDFNSSTFASELATNTGLGIRIDFDFFLVRLDWGIPMRDPSFPKNNRWVINKIGQKGWIWSESLLNVAINYPF